MARKKSNGTRKTRAEILSEVFERQLNYKNVIHPDFPPLSERVGPYTYFLKINGVHNNKIESDSSIDEGWQTIEDIEKPESPYGSPLFKRHNYLIEELIERAELYIYLDNKKGKSRNFKKLKIFRLKRDSFTLSFIRYWFTYIYPNNRTVGKYFDYKTSDYYIDMTTQELRDIEEDLDFLIFFFDMEIQQKELPLSLERINKVFRITNRLQNHIKKNPEYKKLIKDFNHGIDDEIEHDTELQEWNQKKIDYCDREIRSLQQEKNIDKNDFRITTLMNMKKGFEEHTSRFSRSSKDKKEYARQVQFFRERKSRGKFITQQRPYFNDDEKIRNLVKAILDPNYHKIKKKNE